MLQSIDITPANPSIQVGQALRLTATGHYSDGTTSLSIYPMTWSSEVKSVATVDVSGTVSALATGSTTISITTGQVTASTTLTVTSGQAAVSYIYGFGAGAAPGGIGGIGPLLQASDGNFYGVAAGGTYNGGLVFKLSADGVETVLYAFGASASDGRSPSAPLIQARDGNLYGTTNGGGAYGLGTVFKLTLDGVETTLYSFGASPSDGIVPFALVQGRDGNFYGTTASGGANYCNIIPGSGHNCGTVFKVTPGGVETVLYSFGANPSDAMEPQSYLVQASDGNFYGTTSEGGIYSCTTGAQFINDCGTVFRITADGVETVLYSFGANPSNGSPPDGLAPQGPLIQASDGNLYGTTSSGGHGNCGTVFKITLDGAESVLYALAGEPDGCGPSPFLIQGSDGNFYGTARSGGAFGGEHAGTAFRITPAGAETVLYSFGPLDINPSDPGTGMIQASDGAFYGVTDYGSPLSGTSTSVFKLVITQ